MRTLRGLFLFLSIFFFIYHFTKLHATEGKSLNLIVLANRGHEEAYNKWKPLTDYIQEKTRYKINLIPYNFLQIEGALQNKTADLIITNSQYFVLFQERYGIKPIATLKTGNSTHICGVIITRRDSGIKSLEDIEGKKIAIVSKESPFGYLAQTALLLEKGIDIREKAEIWSAENQDNVVYAVYNKAFQVGFLNAEVYNNLIISKKVNPDELFVINAYKDNNINLICSTPSWPNWAVATSSNINPDIAQKIQNALLNISNDPEAIKKTQASFAPPQDYSAVKRALDLLAGIKPAVKEEAKPKKK